MQRKSTLELANGAQCIHGTVADTRRLQTQLILQLSLLGLLFNIQTLFNLLDLPKQLVKIPTFEQDEPMYQHS
jgi:hypothetical protein